MIGLPEVVGPVGFVSVEEIVRGTVGFAPGVGQRDQGRIQLLHDPIHTLVVGHGPAIAECHVPHLSVDKGHSRWRCAQGEPFDQLLELGWQAVRLVPRSLRRRRASRAKPSRRYWASHRCAVRSGMP